MGKAKMSKKSVIIAGAWRVLTIAFGGWLTYVFISIYVSSEGSHVNPLAIAHEPNIAMLRTEVGVSILILLFGLWGVADLCNRMRRGPRYVQSPNPASGTYILLDTKRKIVVGRSDRPFRGIPMWSRQDTAPPRVHRQSKSRRYR